MKSNPPRLAYFFVIWFGLASFPVHAGRLQLVHADSALGRMVEGRLVRELIGSVEFRQDSARMVCDHAIQYIDEKRIRFIGRVLIDNPPRRLGADEIWYYEETKEQLARGRAWLRDQKRRLTADSLHYFENEERAAAKGRVQLHDEKEQSRLRSDQMEYWRLQGHARAFGRPVFTRQDTTQNDSLVITADNMELFDDGERIQAATNVEISKGNFHAVCGVLEYRKSGSRIMLTQQPRAARDDDWMRGVEIEIGLHDRRIDNLRVRGQAAVVSRVDTLMTREPLYDFLSGEEIYIRLYEEQVDSVYVKGRATSYFHLFEKKENQGINKVLGDEIRIKFKQGKMHKVDVVSSPAVSNGIFFPRDKQQNLQKELQALIQQVMTPVKEENPARMEK